MFAEEDPWWWVAVALLIGLLVAEALMPVYLIKPAITTAEQWAAAPPGTELAPVRKPMGATAPALAIPVALFLAALSAWKMYDEKEIRSRWTWMLVAGAMTLLWAILMLKVTMTVGARLAGTGSYLPVTQ